jgi:outer membrane lipoprotein-sorting protein
VIRHFWLAAALTLAALGLSACVAYAPVAAPAPSAFDRAYNGALAAAQDVGIQVTSADPATGQIRGTRGGQPVNISVTQQPDGSARVQFDGPGATQREPDLATRFAQSYQRRTGR